MPDLAARMAFIRDHTRSLPVASVPGVSLYQADEVTPLWLMTEQALDQARLAPPFWAFAWSGGQALARYILENPALVRGKRVLDMACGSGLVGIAALKAGAASALCNDIDPYAEVAVALNGQLNGVAPVFLGGDLLHDDPPADIDLILAGDICYEKAMSEAMLSYFRRAARHTIAVYIGDPHRTYFPYASVDAGLKKVAAYTILTHADIEDGDEKAASVWQMETSHGHKA
ncbi:50S ribosomal protein L11 methyltransferase [Asticcacaulis sp. EMRT-3]|uniref:class I SAM-dependent methyltransferase n=1 Tax=Asticcacaulis sp. EMRT-3 TaxID=3040349 RepID=UPI0024AF0F98|nr:50S ribosomal protein L11 methyltransferase [Asticcacaulis sp. EMRT-3]MDI7774077.1 50S ribosomal protein L11 methyltransferase [Asticcacaulis sp. EMRT-3]